MGYNPKDLWSVSRLHKEHPERADHPTQKPLEIIERMLKASCPPDGVVLDLFMGSGTTALAAKRCGRRFVGFELNPDYCDIIRARLAALDAPQPEPTKPAKRAPKKPAVKKIVKKATAKPAKPAKAAEAVKKTPSEEVSL